MNRIYTITKLSLFLIACLHFTACTKSADSPGYKAAISERYPIFDRNGDTLGHFKIHENTSGLAIVTLEGLPSWMFSSGNTYEVAFYDGPTFNDLYSQLQQLTSNQSSWTTFPVKEYASGKTVLAADLIKMSGLKLSISAPSEVVGIGNIK